MKKIFPLLLPFLILFGCKKDTPINPIDQTPTPNNQVPIIIPNGDEQYLQLNSDYIYDQDKLPTFELTLPEESLRKIDNDPAAEEYVAGSLTFEVETISPVGIRYKGSIGAFVNCLSGSNLFDPSGRKTCTKLSMKVKINWDGREERFYDLKKLQFHSQNLDRSQMRDRLAYWLFREMGVPAPRSVHARLIINGNYMGIYSLPEQIDGRFTRYNFEDGKGNLYKEIWPLQTNGQPQMVQRYLDALKTNEDENPTTDLINGFAQDLAAADDNTIQSVISNWMDVEKIMAYAVVDRTIRADDGPFHWYCSGGGCSNHNYYWYEETAAGKLHLIPWDMDNAFENIIANTNPVTPIADAWGEISNNCEPFTSGFFGSMQWSAACDKLTAGWVSFEDEFAAIKTQLIAGPLSEAVVNARLDAWANQIRAATEEAQNTHSDAVTVVEWENAIQALKTQLHYAREN